MKLLKVLMLEDSEDDALLVRRHLKREGYEMQAKRVDTPHEMRAALASREWDVILSDFKMPGFSGLDALAILKESGHDIPFILISGTVGEETAVRAMLSGASDYLMKDNLARLAPAIERELQELEQRRARREAERSLHESEERLKLALSGAGMGAWEWNLRTDAVFWSPECYEILGVTNFGNWLNDFQQLFHPEDAGRVMEAARRAIAERTPYKAEFRVVRPGGEVMWVANLGRADYDESGEPLRLVGLVQDITGRRRDEEALRESEERFHTMANSIPQLAWMAHADGFIFWYNRRWYEYTGTTPEQMEGWGWQSVHDPEVLNEVLIRWQEAIATGQSFDMEFPLRGADGQFRTFLTRVQPLKDAQGRVVRWFGTNTDVDELKSLEEALRGTQARLNSALRAGSIGTWSWDVKSDQVVGDVFVARTFSLDEEAVAEGLPVEAYLAAISQEDRPAVEATLERARQTNGFYDMEFRVQLIDGELRWLQARGQAKCDERGSALRFDGAIMDITERKLAEVALHTFSRRLVEAQEAERTRIAREVHDLLGQLLTALKMDLSMCVRKLPEPHDEAGREKFVARVGGMQELTDEIIRTVQHISAELRPGVLDTLGLVAAIEWQANEFENRTEISCTCDLPLSPLDVSPERATAMFRIFQEILTNIARHSQATAVEISLHNEESQVVLTVQDNGRGMTEEELAAAASSLGLMGMRERARLFGGDINISSERGKGTRVVAALPLGDA